MIATMGEALVDMIELPGGQFQACLGGSVCNLAIGLARQGVPTTYLNPLSTDRFGQRFAALFRESGVQLALPEASTCPTSIAVVNVDERGAPDYAFHRQHVADRDISADALIARFPEPLEVLHTGGLALVPEDLGKTLSTLAAANRLGALISIDANVRLMAVSQASEYLAGIRQAIRHAHIVKASDEDLANLGLAFASSDEVRDLCFGDTATRLVAVTRGAAGATLITRSGEVALPAPAGLPVADTVGAGDCFHAGLLAYLYRNVLLNTHTLGCLEQPTLLAALRHALAAASLNVMRSGCDPATWEETRSFPHAAQS